jgi:hypothetical protein
MGDDAPTTPAGEEWVTAAEASRMTGLPVRTVYRWVKSGSLLSREDGKSKSVPLREVQRLASQRGHVPSADTVPRAVPASAGAAHVIAGVTVPSAQIDGETAARLFARFEAGSTPADVVREERLAPALVGTAYQQHRQLNDLAGAKGEPRLHDLVKGIAKGVTDLRAQQTAIDTQLAREFIGQANERAEQRAALNDIVVELRSVRQTIDVVARTVMNIYSILTFRGP